MYFVRGSLLLVSILALTGCSSLLYGSQESIRSGTSSSLVDYLYPDGELPPGATDTLPHLDLPVAVGIAFVPSNGPADLGAAEKNALLEQVADAFRDRQYVKSIQTIPDQYLRGASGIVGMQQVAALYGVDVMALVSYDQLSFSGERDSAILYWTIVGTAIVKGNTNEVQTMIDTAVFDVGTAGLLFRAPGVHRAGDTSTLFEQASELRRLRSESFSAANEDMIGNLDSELSSFVTRVEAGERASVSWSGGAGSVDILLLSLLGGVLFARRHRTERVLD